MRIAFVVNNYPPRTGGVELHVHALASELTRQGHKVLVVTLGPETGWSHDAGAGTNPVEILTLPEHFRVADILGFPSLGTRRHLTHLLKERGIDVVSVHTRFFPMSYIGMRAARATKLPLVHTEHGSDHVASDSAIIRFASRMVDFTLGRKVLRSADRVLGVSENVTAFTHRLAGVDGEVFYNAVDAIPAGGAADPGSASRPTHLVFAGRLVAGKGWRDFLEVVAATRADHPELTAEILGDGADMDQVLAQINSLGLSDIVSVRGRVSQTEVLQALRGATLVNPSTLAEGFQNTVLEAIVGGGRVVSYSVPSAEVLLKQGANVTITEQKDAASLTAAVAKVLRDPGEHASRDLIDRWTWPARATQFAEVCAAVADHKN
ncbi:glycosyltransferase family 4 protein [Leucobacter viscericola]|uniref:D-inositol 3-phosphate glycosyltransferase n=1 Tax=Leucobacter viscericola TaxID=2714935 RepID=A0A6G7XF54_9MICO|nr:glycosyltransferase family 4 protein [Leucobacter viscericola]QIK63008.1 glycosyltransferase family 4 protein [Leucobacter viscericola]